MTRDELLAEVDRVLAPIGEVLAKGRLGMQLEVSPALVHLTTAYANARSLQAIALAGTPVAGELLELVCDPAVPAPGPGGRGSAR